MITDPEIWDMAEATLRALPVKERVEFWPYMQWEEGFRAAMREAIARLTYFGMSDDEIRTALGLPTPRIVTGE